MALGEVLVLGKVLVLVRVRLAKVRVVICGSVVIALGKVLVSGSLWIITLRPLADTCEVFIRALELACFARWAAGYAAPTTVG